MLDWIADEDGRQESGRKNTVGGDSGELWKPKATRLPLKAHAATTSVAADIMVVVVVDCDPGCGGVVIYCCCCWSVRRRIRQ